MIDRQERWYRGAVRVALARELGEPDIVPQISEAIIDKAMGKAAVIEPGNLTAAAVAQLLLDDEEYSGMPKEWVALSICD